MSQKSPNRRTFLAAAAGASSLGLAGCIGSITGSSNTDSGGITIRHVFEHGMSTGGPTYYPAAWGNELGFFRDEEVSVDAFIGMGGGASMKQLAAGNFQINTNAMDSTVLAVAGKSNVSQILNFSGLSHGLVAQSKFKSVDDLPESIDLAISNPTSGSTGAAMMMLTQMGVDPNRVSYITIGGSRDRYLAVSNGDAHVGASVLDVALETDSDPNAKVLKWAFEAAPDFYYMGTACHDPWVDKNDANYESAVRHTTACLRTMNHAFENQGKFREWLLSREYVSEETIDRYMELSFGDGGFLSRDGVIKPDAVKKYNMETLHTTENIDKPFPDTKDVVRTDIREDAVKRLESEYDISL